jgi:hypothetical protein
MSKKLLLLISAFVIKSAVAQSPQDIVDSFFKIYTTNQPVKALEDLYSHAPWLKDKNEGVENLKTKFSTLQEYVGDFRGYELLNTKSINNSFTIITYLVRFNSNPMTFTFQFYKPDKDWIVYSFSYDDSIVADLEKAVKEEIVKAKPTK